MPLVKINRDLNVHLRYMNVQFVQDVHSERTVQKRKKERIVN